MATQSFIAIDERINGEKVKGVFHTSIFKMIACSDKKCTVATKGDVFTVTKEEHPKTYANFRAFTESSNVFRASKDN